MKKNQLGKVLKVKTKKRASKSTLTIQCQWGTKEWWVKKKFEKNKSEIKTKKLKIIKTVLCHWV